MNKPAALYARVSFRSAKGELMPVCTDLMAFTLGSFNLEAHNLRNSSCPYFKR